MKGDRLVPKKIKESEASGAAKHALATIWQYEIDKNEKTRSPYKEAYRAAVKSGANESRAENEN